MHDAIDARDRQAEPRRIAELEAELAAMKGAYERLQRAYARALEELQLLKQRLFVAKAERADTTAEQLAFDAMAEEVRLLEKVLDVAGDDDGGAEDTEDNDPKTKNRKPGGRGRRDLTESNLPVIRVEITDPECEGKAKRIGVEESSRLGYERGGPRRVVLARVVYKIEPETLTAEDAKCTDSPDTDVAKPRFVTAALPKELFRRSFLAPSMIAHILVAKYLLGVPFYRLEQQMALQGAPLDRGTMCRYAEDVGATLGAIVEAARTHAFKTAFCLSTDATGVSIQLGPISERKEQKRGPCRKGHFFVVLADREHIFFEYQPKHTSAAVCAMFKGFAGYVQADAHAIYDAMFRGAPAAGEEAATPPIEVGCLAHSRRKFWEAAVCKHPLGLEGLRRINAIFDADSPLADLAPAQRKTRRDIVVRPLVDAFFDWVKTEHPKPKERGLVATALGYAVNQEAALRRFLDDGRLRPDNNASERALRAIASARKAWLFFGSDDHAAAAANLFSLVASCKLHGLDPEMYLADVIRVMPYWPRDRYLELAPRYWTRTRAALDVGEMNRPLGHVTVPATLAAEEQGPTG